MNNTQKQKETAIHNEQHPNSKQDFKETFKTILNSNSFKEECQKLFTKKVY